MKGLGLLLVAVVSGMLWWLIQQGNVSPPSDSSGGGGTPKPTAGQYPFARVADIPKPVLDSNCEEHSYQKVKTFFKDKKCAGLIRELYTTTVDGRKVYTSVAVVDMDNAQDAQALKELTEQNNTGNVADLVREGRVKVQGLGNLSGGGFAAKVSGSHVTIVESDFEGGSKNADEETLDKISTDALRLGDEMRQG
jgi:hypothetical protein